MLDVDNTPGIRMIGMSRAAKRNAIGVELTLAIEKELSQLVGDPSVEIVIFYGKGGHFSAGMDLKEFFSQPEKTPELSRARAATENWRTGLLWRLPQTIVCAVEGYCLGSALPFLAAADVVIAHRNALFGLPEINFGFVPGGQILKAASRAMTSRALAYAALTGKPLDAERALQWGLITRIVDNDPLSEAVTVANAILGRPAQAV